MTLYAAVPRSWTWAAHAAVEHQCCRVVAEDRCGLWCGHDEGHVPYTPGDYLPEPILHPLTLLKLRRTRSITLMRCPLCGSRTSSWDAESGLFVRQIGDEIHQSTESLWRFWSCGCEGREILPDQAAEA